jgi:putative acetyltransferase
MESKMKQIEFMILKADTSHVTGICNVLIKSITENCKADHGDDSGKLDDWLSNKTPENIGKWINDNNNFTVVALNNWEEVIGTSLITKDGEILLNYLVSDYLGKGIGKAMLDELELFAKENGLKQITANSTITALPFYKKNGFQVNVNPKNIEADETAIIKILTD